MKAIKEIPAIKKFLILKDENKDVYKLELYYNRKTEELIKIVEKILIDDEFVQLNKLTRTSENSLSKAKMEIIEYYINVCNMDIIFIKGDNEKIARKSSYERNELFRKESHELHKMRLSIHKACIDAIGHGNWKRKYRCPINLFNEDIEELIKNAVELGNWAAIENYDPLEGY